MTTDTVSDEATGLANKELVERLAAISGIQFTARMAPPLCHPVVEVRLLGDSSDVETAVYRAEMEVRQRFPTARLDVRVL